MRITVDLHVDEDTPVFVISVAAQLAGMHPQTLRQYDRLVLMRTVEGSAHQIVGHTSLGCVQRKNIGLAVSFPCPLGSERRDQ
jgi:hypothetical protein